jgi:hypothetical protein
VDELIAMYGEVRADLREGAYGTDTKISATGKTVDVPSFKAQQFATARGLLDDIAKEEGGRKTNMKVDGDLRHSLDLVSLMKLAKEGEDQVK